MKRIGMSYFSRPRARKCGGKFYWCVARQAINCVTHFACTETFLLANTKHPWAYTKSYDGTLIAWENATNEPKVRRAELHRTNH